MTTILSGRPMVIHIRIQTDCATETSNLFEVYYVSELVNFDY